MAARDGIRFPNLNGLRFLAALVVLAAHLEQDKAAFGLPARWDPRGFFALAGSLSVNLFFVLSGFLITYLLLAEERSSGRIALTRFYARRMLRIWPLYFAVVALALFVFPRFSFFNPPGFDRAALADHFLPVAALYLTFFANLVIPLFGVVPYASHAWSIGTEEQFYLLWPLLLRIARAHRLAAMVGIIAVYLGILRLLPDGSPAKAFWCAFQIDSLAAGGIFAALLFRQSPWLRLLMHPAVFAAALLAACVLPFIGRIPHLQAEIYALLFAVVILNFAAQGNLKVTLENPLFDYLGRISYGSYMLHPLGITLALRLGAALGLRSSALLLPIAFAITTALASFSYRFFEGPFLRWKDARFAARGKAESAPGKRPQEAARQ